MILFYFFLLNFFPLIFIHIKFIYNLFVRLRIISSPSISFWIKISRNFSINFIWLYILSRIFSWYNSFFFKTLFLWMSHRSTIFTGSFSIFLGICLFYSSFVAIKYIKFDRFTSNSLMLKWWLLWRVNVKWNSTNILRHVRINFITVFILSSRYSSSFSSFFNCFFTFKVFSTLKILLHLC